MLAASIYVSLRTAAYRRVLMRMRGICSIRESILFQTPNLPTTEHTFSGFCTSVHAIPRALLYWQSLFHHKGSLMDLRHSQGIMTAVGIDPRVAGLEDSPARQSTANRETKMQPVDSARVSSCVPLAPGQGCF